jgi:hypothetical protein
MMIIDPPVASYSPPNKILEWITQLESARQDPDAEPFDLVQIDDYLNMARGWLGGTCETTAPESGSAA